jgi:hypothetical protein
VKHIHTSLKKLKKMNLQNSLHTHQDKKTWQKVGTTETWHV